MDMPMEFISSDLLTKDLPIKHGTFLASILSQQQFWLYSTSAFLHSFIPFVCSTIIIILRRAALLFPIVLFMRVCLQTTSCWHAPFFFSFVFCALGSVWLHSINFALSWPYLVWLLVFNWLACELSAVGTAQFTRVYLVQSALICSILCFAGFNSISVELISDSNWIEDEWNWMRFLRDLTPVAVSGLVRRVHFGRTLCLICEFYVLNTISLLFLSFSFSFFFLPPFGLLSFVYAFAYPRTSNSIQFNTINQLSCASL